MRENIQLFVPTFRVEECLAEIRECLEKGWTGMGFKTISFEQAWREYARMEHSHFLASNSVGLHLAIRILRTKFGWKDGDEIISSPITFVSGNHAIRYENLKPIFADVDEYLCLDPASVEERITERTRAVLFVGLGGNSGRYHEVLRICRERGLAMILDAAHMSGTRYRGRHVGHDADVSVFSFQAVKNLPTADAGMICFANREDDARARKLSWLGINKDTYTRSTSTDGNYKWLYDVEEIGYKYHGNSIMAAIGLVQLRYLDQDNEYRRSICAVYDESLQNHPQVVRVPMADGCESSRHLYQVLVPERDRVIAHMQSLGVFPGVHYRDNTEYTMYSDGAPCPRARTAASSVISLPLHLRMTRETASRVSAILTEAVERCTD